MEERVRFVEDWNSEDWNMGELCEFYGVTWKTGYKWVERYEAQGAEGLRDLSRAPHRHPKQVTQEMEDWVIGLREKHPSWGAPQDPGAVVERAVGQDHPCGEHDWRDAEAPRFDGAAGDGGPAAWANQSWPRRRGRMRSGARTIKVGFAPGTGGGLIR